MTADEWNVRYPVGTRVRRYSIWHMAGDPPEAMRRCAQLSRTRSEAWTLGDGTAVVAVEGFPGGQALDALEVIDPVGDAPGPGVQ